MPSMTSLERATTTINHGIPDRVPTDLHNFLFTLKFAGFSMDELAAERGDAGRSPAENLARVRARHPAGGKRRGVRGPGLRLRG